MNICLSSLLEFDRVSAQDSYTTFDEPALEHVIDGVLDDCKGHNKSWLQLVTDGSAETKAKFGFSLIGTLQPFKVEQAYGFMEWSYDFEADIHVSGTTGLSTDYKVKPAHLQPQQEHLFVHPGIVSFRPSFDINIGIEASNASFKA